MAVAEAEGPPSAGPAGPARTYDVGRSLSTDYFGLQDQFEPAELDQPTGAMRLPDLARL